MRVGLGAADASKAAFSSEGAPSDIDVITYGDAAKLAADLRSGSIDAAVRGDLGSNAAMAAVRREFGVSKVLRAAYLRPPQGRMFLLAPVGVDEGWTVEEKVELGRLCAGSWPGGSPQVGVMSGGRSDDLGRHARVDATIRDAAAVVASLRSEGIDAADVQILIEDAARQCDVLIAPDGVSGNLIFRTLHFLGGWDALGAPVLNIGRVYVDTSRAKASYADSIELAASLARRG